MGFLETLKELVQVPGVSGYEHRVREKIQELVGGLGETWTDTMGNLVLELGEGVDSILLAAHMDELGLLVTHIEKDGTVRFRKIGGIDDRILPSQHVTIHTEGGDVPGVIGMTPPHLQLEKDLKVVPWNQLYIDVGASSEEEARGLGIDVLDPVTFHKPWSLLNRGKVVSTRAIDDRFGCAVLVELARLIADGKVRPKYKVYLAWTTQEEVGLRGAWALAHRVNPTYMASIDTSTCCNPVITGPLKPGAGPVLRAVDNSAIVDPALGKRIVSVARSHGIPLQVVSVGGGTDAAAFQRVATKAFALGVPVKYTHSTTEYIHVEDVEKLIQLISALLEDGLQG